MIVATLFSTTVFLSYPVLSYLFYPLLSSLFFLFPLFHSLFLHCFYTVPTLFLHCFYTVSFAVFYTIIKASGVHVLLLRVC
jgi:hypothetical protein